MAAHNATYGTKPEVEAKLDKADAAATYARNADVEAAVAAAVADDEAVASAAALAVTGEIAGRDLLESTDPRVHQAIYSDFLLIETDQSGRASRTVDRDGRTWVNLDPSVSVPGAAQHVDAYDTAYSIVDQSGRVAFKVDGEGAVHIPKLVPSAWNGIVDLVRQKVASGPDIVAWGDSMTAGAGGGGVTYPSVVSSLSGRMVHNRGVGGESTVTIAARASAVPMHASPVGGTIPASGSVELSIKPVEGTAAIPLLQGALTHWDRVTFAGVQGSITRNSTTGAYSFTRKAAGDVVDVPYPTAVVNDEGVARRGDIALIWIGQNGPSHARAMADVAAIIQEMTAHEKRFLVLSKPKSTDAEDSEWHALYGRRFISPRKHLNEYGLQLAGISPTSQDQADIAAGIVPTSLRSDETHFNAAGYTVLGQYVHARLKEFGWV